MRRADACAGKRRRVAERHRRGPERRAVGSHAPRGELGYDGRYRILEPVLARTFDFPLMARLSVSRHWTSLDEAEKGRLIELFAAFSVATFAARFDGYGGEVFEVSGEEPRLRGAVLVLNRLVRPSDDPVPINYLLRQSDGAWRIVDVLLDGKFSELALKRSEYTSVLSRDGFAGLIAALEAKVAALAADG